MSEQRLARLRSAMAEAGIPTFLVTQIDNVGYLSGFSGSSAALAVTPDAALFFTDGRYATQAQRQCPGFDIRQSDLTQSLMERVTADIKTLGADLVGIEGNSMTVNQLEALQKGLEGVELRPTSDVVETLRRIKDEGEI